MSLFIAGVVFVLIVSPLVAHTVLWTVSRQLQPSDRPEPSGRDVSSRDIPGSNSNQRN